MKEYLKNWNFMRVLRLVMGVFIMIQAIMAQQWMIAALGGLFSLLPLINIGCCGVSTCGISAVKSNEKNEDVTYEEVH